MNEEQLKKELYEALRKDDVGGFQLLINQNRNGNYIYYYYILTSKSFALRNFFFLN